MEKTEIIKIIILHKANEGDEPDWIAVDGRDYDYVASATWEARTFEGSIYAWNKRFGYLHNVLFTHPSRFNDRLICLDGDGLNLRSSNWRVTARPSKNFQPKMPEKAKIAPKTYIMDLE